MGIQSLGISYIITEINPRRWSDRRVLRNSFTQPSPPPCVPWLENCDLAKDSRGKEVGKRGGRGERGPREGILERHF